MGREIDFGTILVVDDEESILELLDTTLSIAGFRVFTAKTLDELKQLINQRSFDAIVLDLFLGEEDGLSALPFLVTHSPRTQIIMMSAHGTIELAVDAMKMGASSFISKTKNPHDIVDELKLRLKKERNSAIAIKSSDNNFGIIGSSPSIKAVLEKIDKVKDNDANVLLVGESGTGKELVARAIHNASQRSGKRFEAINCAAIPANLLESELFGHKKGAFTDAKSDRKGIFELCSEGTLLLDEIGEMPLSLQVKLLRVLQEREVTPIGSSTSIKVDTRIIAATNRNLKDEVKAGNFREDLFYRLAVLPIEIPPLRQRKDDISLLVQYFLDLSNKRLGKSVNQPSPELSVRLKSYSWPGNVRELQNAIERGVVLAKDNQMNYDDMIEPMYSTEEKEAGIRSNFLNKSLSNAKHEFEKEYLKQLLEVTKGNISEIARISGRYRADVYRLLSKHGIVWEDFRPV